MANGWGGRRAGAGAPKGNNNRVRHGEYSKLPLPFLPSNGKALTGNTLLRAQIIICLKEQQKLPDISVRTRWEQRECWRLDGLVGQRVDQIIRNARRYSRERLAQDIATCRQYREIKKRLKEVQQHTKADDESGRG